MGWMNQGSNCNRGKRFSSCSKRPYWLWCPPSLLLNVCWGFLWG